MRRPSLRDTRSTSPRLQISLASVPEAPELVRERVHHVTRASGGRGAVREVCDLLLAAQGHADAELAHFS